MKYLLDTNICTYLIKRTNPVLSRRLLQHRANDVGVSTITLAELTFGVEKSQQKADNQKRLDDFLADLQLAPFDRTAAKSYGQIRFMLQKRGTPIGPLDTLIAGHALALKVALVTNNVSEFSRVPDLNIEDWTLEEK